MPVPKKAPLGPKAKLMKMTITALRKKAKALGVSDYTKRTKENLVLSIMLAEARKKRGVTSAKKVTVKRKATSAKSTQVGVSNKKADAKRKAMPPGKRKSATGKVYYERRKNRSDKAGTMLGESTANRNKAMVDFKKRKKQEVQAWYKECVGTRPTAGLFAMTFGKKPGVYGNPDLLVAVYRLPKRVTRGTTYPALVGVGRYGYGNGLNDIEQYLSPAQFSKFWYNDSIRQLDTAEFNNMAKHSNTIYL